MSSSSPEELVHPVHFSNLPTSSAQSSWHNEQSLSSNQSPEMLSPKNEDNKHTANQAPDVGYPEGMFEME